MNHERLQRMLSNAVAAGILPANVVLEHSEDRPWPVVILIAIGAWLAAIPLFVVVIFLTGDFVTDTLVGPYVVGLSMVTIAVLLLKKNRLTLFVEQLAIPALLVGCGVLTFGLFENLPNAAAAMAMALLVIGIIWAIKKPWLRSVLGATAAVFVGITVWSLLYDWHNISNTESQSFWWALHILLLLWIVITWLEHRLQLNNAYSNISAATESALSGWILILTVGLALWAGMTFLVGASLGGSLSELNLQQARQVGIFLPAISVCLGIAACSYLAYSWPILRQPWCAGVAIVFVGLSALMPTLGAVLLVIAVNVASQRWQIAGAAGLAAAWIIGAFYYQLDFSLAYKALLLMGAGAALAGLAWLGFDKPASVGAIRWAPQKLNIGIIAALLSVLMVLNFGIWQKEQLIAKGQPVYVALMPVDPRSLMQGDFMRLNYEIPTEILDSIDDLLLKDRPFVIAKRDAKQIATVLRLDRGAPLAAEEFRIELSPQDGRWVLVSDAWFFKEGEAERWSLAKYAEFRVDKNGRALLIGLRGENLQPL